MTYEPERYSGCTPSPGVAWYHRPVWVVAGLVILYPLGLLLLARTAGIRGWRKAAVGLVCLPVFALVLMFLLSGCLDFGGGGPTSDVRFDFFRGWWQDRRVEQHRQAQGRVDPATFKPAAEFASLSWPEFRGPKRDGVVRDGPISVDWKAAAPRALWRQPVGEGYAAFVVGAGRLFTIEQRRDKEAVVCYDAATGREIWLFEYRASFEETLGGDGPRATPTLQGERLYALGAEGHLNCHDATTGRRHWRCNTLSDFGAKNLSWGMSASPLVVDDKVIVTNSGIGGGSILAYHAETGELLWKTDAGQQGYSSPVVAKLAGRRQILNLAAYALNGLDPANGAILWSFPWKTEYGINVSQPIVVGDDRIFVSSGYGHGCALVQLESAGGAFRPRELWSNISIKNKFSSSVLHDGFVYGLDERVLACVEVATGERKWKGGRYDYGSILLVGDHILVLSEDGLLALVKASPEAFEELGRLQILEGRTWNNPAVAGGYLFARNHKEMVCYDLRPAQK